MGIPLTIQPNDDSKIRDLQARLSVKTKIQVVRAGLALLEREAERLERVEKWKRAVRAVKVSSGQTNRAFVTARAGIARHK